MSILSHILGFPRIGLNRELKKGQESYWKKEISYSDLKKVGFKLRNKNWLEQKKLGLDFITVGDFAWYDHVLTMSMILGNVPKRYKEENYKKKRKLDLLFSIARGSIKNGKSIPASDMTKWFNTNYHYIVPEFFKNQKFFLGWNQLFDEVEEALLLNSRVKVVLIGPITYLWLGKTKDRNFNKLDLLKSILTIYKEIFIRLKNLGVDWVQIDEPILAYELSETWKQSFSIAYEYLSGINNLLLTTYFGDISHNLDFIIKLPVEGLHVDLIYGQYDLNILNSLIPKSWVLSLGIINGRNIWKSNLLKWFDVLNSMIKSRDNTWISSSCSLLHVPIDVTVEKKMELELKNCFSFAIQKCKEICLLSKSLNTGLNIEIKKWYDPILNRNIKSRNKNISFYKKIKIFPEDLKRNSSYNIRYNIQKLKLKIPILPTTTIGSFPQTKDIRKLRFDFKNKLISNEQYEKEICKNIKYIISEQEKLNLDILVHGEPERNDMVEYFGEKLEGFVFTENGWVQSYGSRCVKPPIIVNDIKRKESITVKWTVFAQSLTKKIVKGMLTGPVTILLWSFFREDLSKEEICNQIALALREEVLDLESSGIKIIQIDEPALREGLPLRKTDWKNYLSWSINSFRLVSSSVKDQTQIHTHMCYCEFNEIMPSIVNLDADVITIETARSDMELLDFFKKFKYPNSIGPGVYDIHSPNIPTIDSIEKLLRKALKTIPVHQLWVNPDCGLKTRSWKETRISLKNMVEAVERVRYNLIPR
ncbi:5-methyltetrahydropteroyltriglutamate--homocysteine methyltransferase [Buchnera aphidicola (Tetraneura ulmi)]|uniref:5-methyltetrahydropteroyltriglutamate-- homocysteine S-methyltransferase n=1 Tax=Buchnera aphidicola TaxID=9 RepID=UPI003464338A